MNQEIKKLYDILVEMLGESKSGYSDGQFEYEFPCPCCVEKYGTGEIRKYNLSISLSKQKMNCWKCSSEGGETHGSIIKLIKRYGTPELLEQYKNTIRSIRESELYKLNFSSNEFNIDTSVVEREELKFPESFKYFDKKDWKAKKALKYLNERGIDWDIIEKYHLGYTSFQEEDKKSSYRIIIPSYDEYGELNYWVGRNYLPLDRIKYDNPEVEKRDIIFNEEKVQWDADVTLVEGPFDHLVVPNSIPLLGKALNQGYKLYWDLLSKCNGNINIFLDADAKSTVYEIYKLLNHGRLYNKIRYIPVEGDEDPSSLYQKGGYKEIARHLRNAQQIEEVYLI
jgi:hypothetical protein